MEDNFIRMEMDYSEERRREFYWLMGLKKKDIKSLDIPIEQKDKLYKSVKETIQIYENNLISHLERKEEMEGLNHAFKKEAKKKRELSLRINDSLEIEDVFEMKMNLFDIECSLQERRK